MTNPSAKTCAKVHAKMFANRHGHSLREVLSKIAVEGFYWPAEVIEVHGHHWLRLKEPAGHYADKIALSVSEAAARTGVLMQ